MNRWMKRRIERSRARCERAEIRKRDESKELAKIQLTMTSNEPYVSSFPQDLRKNGRR
jgi:hypothetical protein